jgi:hypothetical protein
VIWHATTGPGRGAFRGGRIKTIAIAAAVFTQGVFAAVNVVGTPVMSKIETTPCPAEAPPAATRILSTDRTLSLWFKLTGLSVDDTITIRQTDPKGALSRVNDLPLKSAPGSQPFCIGKVNPATMAPGKWSIAAYLNDNPAPLFPPLVFTLERAAVQPPAPLAEDASIEATMKFIEDGLNAQGLVEFVNGPADAAFKPVPLFGEVTGAVANAARCDLSFHWLTGSDGGMGPMGSDLSVHLSFAEVATLHVIPRQSAPPIFDLSVATKAPTILIRFLGFVKKDPATHLILAMPTAVAQPDRQVLLTAIFFREEAAAQSMAVAIVHAVELCGGGSQDR